MTQKQLFKIAKEELDSWGPGIPRGLVMAILFCFIHRATTGYSIEETMHKPGPAVLDWQI